MSQNFRAFDDVVVDNVWNPHRKLLVLNYDALSLFFDSGFKILEMSKNRSLSRLEECP